MATLPSSRQAAAGSQPGPVSRKDPFYGHETMARMCTRFVKHLFGCSECPPLKDPSGATLPHFIAYALHRTKLHPSIMFTALILLQRLKARYPTAKGSSGHRLFISAFIVACKVISDDSYSNKSWRVVAQGMFPLEGINRMERQLCNYLDWELMVDVPTLSNFEERVTTDFSQDRSSYPDYPLVTVSRRAALAQLAKSNAVPNFGQDGRPLAGTLHPNSPPSQDPTPQPSSALASELASNSNSCSPRRPATTSPATSGSPGTGSAALSDDTMSIHDVDRFKFTVVDKGPEVHPLWGQMFAFSVPSRF